MFTCSNCTRPCLSMIGLDSHSRCCTPTIDQSTVQLPKTSDTVGCQQLEDKLNGKPQSWTKVMAHLVFERTRQMRIQLHLCHLAPPPYNLKLVLSVSPGLQHGIGWGGGVATRFLKKSIPFFSNFSCKTQIICYIT